MHAAIENAAAVALGSLGRRELETFTAEALRGAQRVQALAANAVAEADLAGLGGRKSVNAYFADRLNTSSSQIAPSRILGLWLGHFGILADVWQAGVLSEAHIRELKKVDNVRTRLQLQRDQQMFVDWTETLDFNQWTTALSHWLLHADPNGALDPERERTYGLATRPHEIGGAQKAKPRVCYVPVASGDQHLVLSHSTAGPSVTARTHSNE